MLTKLLCYPYNYIAVVIICIAICEIVTSIVYNEIITVNEIFMENILVPPAVITPNGSRVITDEGTPSFLVNCTAAGIPPPNITWSDPSGMELPNDNNARIRLQDHTTAQLMADDGFTFLYHVTRSLVITNTNDMDTGIYTCTADNGVVAVDSNTVEVFVRGM